MSTTVCRAILELGLVHVRESDFAAAVACFEQIAGEFRDDVGFLTTFANSLRKCGRIHEAFANVRRALELRPESVVSELVMLKLLRGAGARQIALARADRLLARHPRESSIRYVRALLLIELLQNEEAIAALRELVAMEPDHTPAISCLLYLLTVTPGNDPADVAAEHFRLTRSLETCRRSREHPAARRSDGAIRIGFLSPDLIDHPVAYFLEPVLEKLDRKAFKAFCYSTALAPDAVTARLRRLGDIWRDCSRASNDEIATLIRGDAIDVLVDLAGHTSSHRLGVLALKPAPIQVSWLGYPNTTGLQSIDYRIVDAVTQPCGQNFEGTEQPLRLPKVFACFRPPTAAPEIIDRRDRPPTFGSLHKIEKLNDQVLSLWARLLQATPNARLLVARSDFDVVQRKLVARKFKDAAIDSDRLEIRELDSSAPDYLSIFNEIDVLLDVFPWSGHTLACQALWMGTPVVTLAGATHAGRMVASTLTAAGLPELVATDASSYLDIASGLVADRERLAGLQQSLRQRVAASDLCDESAFVAEFEEAISRVVARPRA